MQKSGARFDEQRLLWINGAHIRALSLDDLYQKVSSFWPESSAVYDESYKKAVLGLVQERLKYFGELPILTDFFFHDLDIDITLITENKKLKKLETPDIKALLEQARNTLQNSDFSLDDLTERLNQLLEQTEQKPAILFSLVRIATTQAAASPGLADTLHVLGKEVALRRIEQQLDALV